MSKLSFEIPKYTIEHTIQTFSEVYDWGLQDLNIPDIHKQTQGEGVSIAIVDTGKSEHYEIQDAILGAKNFSSSPVVVDRNGHSCVHPEAYLWTSIGFKQIQDLYVEIENPEIIFQEIEVSATKYVGNCNIHCQSFNKDSQEFEKDLIQYIHKVPVNDEILNIHYGKNQNVKLTQDHPTYILRNGEVKIIQACELKVGDNLISITDSSRRMSVKITNISKEYFDGFFYDLTMKNHPNYMGNGVVISNTFCAGIIAARKNNEGIIGVAPKSKLYFAKAMDDAGQGEPSAMVKAIDWSIKQNVDIISISAGMFFDFKPLHKVIKKAYRKNIIIVAAVGNSGTRHYDVAFPARYPEVIGVAAYDQNHKTARFSSRGINVSFAMPGVDIYSTYLNNQFCKMNGTCLPKSEMIYTPNGVKSIAELTTGEKVYSFNEKSQQIEPKSIINHWSYESKECLDIFTPHTKIRCTRNHPILVKENDNLVWRKAEDIQKHNLIICISKVQSVETQKVIKIKYAGRYKVYDIEVEGNHNFIANNIIVHNSFACPIMAGVCALVLSKHRLKPSNTPCETPSQMMEHLKKYSKKLESKTETGFGTIDLESLFLED